MINFSWDQISNRNNQYAQYAQYAICSPWTSLGHFGMPQDCPNYTVFPAIQDSQAGPKDQMHQDSWHRFRRQVTHRKIPKSPQWFQWSLGYDLGWNGKKDHEFPAFSNEFPPKPQPVLPSRKFMRSQSKSSSCWMVLLTSGHPWNNMEMDGDGSFMGMFYGESLMGICYGNMLWRDTME